MALKNKPILPERYLLSWKVWQLVSAFPILQFHKIWRYLAFTGIWCSRWEYIHKHKCRNVFRPSSS